MLENELIIREPRIPLLNRIVFSLAFALFAILLIHLYNLNLLETLDSANLFKVVFYVIILFFIFLFTVVPLITRHYIHINFNDLKIKRSFEIGMWKHDKKWHDLVELNYISVFKVDGMFQVNLWYEKNSILNLFVLETFEDAIDNAYQIATKLNIELLDASVKGNHQWVDKKEYAETSKITYQ